MKYAIDTEFIDTPTCSALISLALVSENDESLYFEFDYPEREITPWLRQNVTPHLSGHRTTFQDAAHQIRLMIPNHRAVQFWCYYGAYDWYWFCRLWGGFMDMPDQWPNLFHEFAYIDHRVPNVYGAEHNALNDARSLMVALKRRAAA
jgi:hypothetical protein